jgi:YidC/Oxa1 family membrane protein insertase
MIIAFGITMVLTQKLMSPPPNPNADPEQLLIQQQTQRTMPIAVTGMFFFMPLPSGVFLYMVISNIIQSLQTWIVMKSAKPLTSPSLDQIAANGSQEASAVTKKNSKDRAVVNSATGSQDEIISADESEEDIETTSQSKKKPKKKK